MLSNEIFITGDAYDSIIEDYEIELNEVEDYGVSPIDEDGKREILADLISEYITNYTGYCHYGFNFDLDDDREEIFVYDIEWDIDEEEYEENEE